MVPFPFVLTMQVLLIKAGRGILLNLAPVPLSCNEFCRKTFCFRSLNGKKWFWLPKCGDLKLDFYVRRLNNGKKKTCVKWLHPAHPTLSKSPGALTSHIDLKMCYLLSYLVLKAALLQSISVDL